MTSLRNRPAGAISGVRARRSSGEAGQALVEYGFLLGLVAVTIMFALTTAYVRLAATYAGIAHAIAGQGP